MKFLAAFILAVLPLAAQAADRDVRIFAPANKVRVTGDTVPAKELVFILFTREPCTLPIADKRNTYRAWERAGAYQLGCWYPTTDDGFEFIGQIDSMTRHDDGPWATFPRAKLHDDGSATIVEANYNSTTFAANWFANRNAHLFDHVHDKP